MSTQNFYSVKCKNSLISFLISVFVCSNKNIRIGTNKQINRWYGKDQLCHFVEYEATKVGTDNVSF